MPKVGLLLSGDGMSLADVIDLGVAAEDAGLDSVWHVEIQREPVVPLTAIAARTKRIRLGTGVAIWARSPILASLVAANLDELSDGRFLYGLGTGPPDWNRRFHGISYERPVQRIREYVDVMRGAWKAAYDGSTFDYERRALPRGGRTSARSARSASVSRSSWPPCRAACARSSVRSPTASSSTSFRRRGTSASTPCRTWSAAPREQAGRSGRSRGRRRSPPRSTPTEDGASLGAPPHRLLLGHPLLRRHVRAARLPAGGCGDPRRRLARRSRPG